MSVRTPETVSVSDLARKTRAIVERLARDPATRLTVMKNNRAVAELSGMGAAVNAIPRPATSSLREQVLAKTGLVRTLAQAHGARTVELFGSAARGEETPESDIDLMVELERGRSLLDLIALANDLEEAFGRKVDVVEKSSAKPRVREALQREGIRLL